MEYDRILFRINAFGKYQKIICLFMCIGSSFNSLTSYVLNFIMTNHKHRCQIPGYDQDIYSSPGQVFLNATSIVSYNVTECMAEVNGSMAKCNSWVYDKDFFQNTIISKFDIVCDEKFYRAHFLMTHYIGLLLGSVVCGFLSDTIGRKPVLAIAFLSMLVSTLSRPFIPNITAVTVLEFLNGFGSMVAYIVPFVILTELVGPQKRLFVSFFVYFGFCMGNYVLLFLVFFIRDWEQLMIAVSIPCGLYMIGIAFISESPRWLVSRGRTEEAVKILKRMALLNKREIHYCVEDISVREERNASFCHFIKELIKSKSLLYRLSIVSLNWFALNLIYYGISMNVAKFGGNVFVNYAASSSAELLAIFFCWLTVNRFGRKKLFCSAMILGGVMCLCTIFTYLYGEKSMDWLTTTLVMVGKFFVTITFFVVYLFTGELFPTVLRASALGVASMTGRIGSISSAYIAELDTIIPTEFGKALPLIIYGVVGLAAGLLSIYLPETTDTLLPELVSDAKDIKRTFYSFHYGVDTGALLKAVMGPVEV